MDDDVSSINGNFVFIKLQAEQSFMTFEGAQLQGSVKIGERLSVSLLTCQKPKEFLLFCIALRTNSNKFYLFISFV